MIVRPKLDDLKLIGYFTGKIIIAVAWMMCVPLIVALIYREWNIAIDFFISFTFSLAVGYGLTVIFNQQKEIEWSHGMVIASFSWLLCTVLAALPYWLSGHFSSYLDACFDVMSGWTTTGAFLLKDLDHASNGINMWRHLLTYVGGQGMIVLAMSILVRTGTAGIFKMYVGEAKDEHLLPSPVKTTQAIWKISLVYLIIGTLAQFIAGLLIGMPLDRAFWHGMWVYMGAWSTGGFGPQNQNILYYHSLLYEMVGAVFFIIGSFNFALHYAVWTGKKKEIYRNIEIVSFYITIFITFMLTAIGLMKWGVYPDYMALFRKGFYHLISAHTTTGFMTVYARQYLHEWGNMALVGITAAMLIGGSACSTAGGFKGLRMGLIYKALTKEIRKILLPENAVIKEKFHHIRDNILDERVVRSAALIVLLYCITFTLGVIATVYYGYSIPEAMFEVASVTGNVGLSIGVTSPMMPDFLKLIYIIIMWVGRMEFMAVLALIGFVIAGVRGK